MSALIKNLRKVKTLDNLYYATSTEEILALEKFIKDKMQEAFNAARKSGPYTPKVNYTHENFYTWFDYDYNDYKKYK